MLISREQVVYGSYTYIKIAQHRELWVMRCDKIILSNQIQIFIINCRQEIMTHPISTSPVFWVDEHQFNLTV